MGVLDELPYGVDSANENHIDGEPESHLSESLNVESLHT